MSKISLSKLETFLKAQCDELRAAGLDAAEYKDYIITLLFLKRVNDVFDDARILRENNLKAEYPNISDEQLAAELEIENATEYEFFVPIDARWKEKNLNNPQENIGDKLTIAINALETANKEVLQGVLSSTKFNTVKSNGEKLLSDEVLKTILQNFNKIKLKDENFEFPDLLGAAYEYLIKFFAESAGKKGGEFYTPNEVVQLMGKILQPAPDAEICDPTVGSGGLLINLYNYVEARYGSAKNLTIHGQDFKDSIYKMCKMNMIFHGIKNANIKHGDTFLDPLLVTNGILNTYDIVVVNPPFSQNYTTKDMKFKNRFTNWMSTKKQADFMFVQHMISILKNNGRMAVIMPHGVLFRGGEEQKMRKRIIDNGIVEAIIGLPQGLFYGTGIPASMLIINKDGAETRDKILFINADKEYKEGKNQNSLRPEDIDKISYVYHNKIELDKYSKLVGKADLEAENYNCNIRRYVDNSAPATPHDVQAHLKGGIPVAEIESLNDSFACYDGLKDSLFSPLKQDYMQFSEIIGNKEKIKEVINNSLGKTKAFDKYTNKIDAFWHSVMPQIDSLPGKNSVYDFIGSCTAQFSKSMAEIDNPLLNEFQSRGAFAQYLSDLKYDFKSVAASGWNAELILDEEILESQHPDVLIQLRNSETRRDELDALFKEVNELEEGEWNEDDYEAIPKAQLVVIRDQIKNDNAQKKVLEKQATALSKRISAYDKILKNKKSTSDQIEEAGREIKILNAELIKLQAEIKPIAETIAVQQAGIAKHVEMEEELKKCRVVVKEITLYKNSLVDKARNEISTENAKPLIINRWHRTIQSVILGYLENHTRRLQQSVEELHDKYTVTLSTILQEREREMATLNSFLQELGYE